MEIGATQKQKGRYRTAIAILLSVILLMSGGFGYFMHREFKIINNLEDELSEEKERGYVDMTKFVPRKDHETVVSLLSHKMNRAEFIDELALDELRNLCSTKGVVCEKSTFKTIKLLEDFLKVRVDEKDSKDNLKESMAKEKAELQETLSQK